MIDNILSTIKIDLVNYIHTHIIHVSKSIALHKRLQKFIAAMSIKYGLESVLEYEINTSGYHKFIDVVWIGENGRIVLAIEIDSSFKKGSLIKLNAIEAEHKIWVLYCTDIYKNKYDELMNTYNKENKIEVIYLGPIRKHLKDYFN